VWGKDVYEFPNTSPLHRRLLAGNLRAANWVCSTSQVMAEQTLSVQPDMANLSVTPFGIDTDQFQSLSELREPGAITIGTVKKLAPKYGIDVLIHAFAILKDAVERDSADLLPGLRLLIVGGGPDESKLRGLATELAVDGMTTFVGAVPHGEVPEYLNRMDVYAALSRSDSESFGVAVLEASACGLPVVVSDVGGLPEVVKDGETGFVVERENRAEAADALLQLITNANLRRRMGAAGREHVVESYEWSESVSLMEDVYAQVLKKASVEVAS
jgi:glycosyltransferase involved in cell wall biosynthesis